LKKNFLILFTFYIIFFIPGLVGATVRLPGLYHNPDWLVDEELSQVCSEWNKNFHKCLPPRGGYNKITENQKIINSWGYKARPIEEIKDLIPGPQYNMFSNPEIWGTIRINETEWESAKPRGAMWEEFMAQTEKNKKQVYLDENNWLRGYSYGIPFPVIDEKDPKAAVKAIWNYTKRYQDNDRVIPMDGITKDANGHTRHNVMLNMRLQMSGRTRDDNATLNGIYIDNPKNLEFVYSCPYVAPYNLRGTICLYYRYNDSERDDDMWVYIPSIRRVRRMSTAQHQDRCPGGFDFTWDNTEGFEGHVTRFNWTYLGRKILLIPILGRAHTYSDTKGYISGNDQFYQRRNCHIVKATYKNPINMTEMILFLDPVLYGACYSYDLDLKGQIWIVQTITQARCNNWFYALYDGCTTDILRKHSTRMQFSFSGSQDYRIEDLSMDKLKKVFLSR